MSAPDLETGTLIIGAGVLGLAIGEKLTEAAQDVVLVESNAQFGQETSSRNSEVVHSGIYYPPDSAKTKFCIEGRKRLYDYCEAHHIPIKKVGKFVVAVSESDEEYLRNLASHCEQLDVPFESVTKQRIQQEEPLIAVQSGLYFPETGIVDSHQLMACLEARFQSNGGLLAYQHKVTEVHQAPKGWSLTVTTPQGTLNILAEKVVNAAGLYAAQLTNMALKTTRFQHRFCRGRYFNLISRFNHKFSHLIYPTPQKDGLGIHVTVDMGGTARLGPDVEWAGPEETTANYDTNWEEAAPNFLTAASRYCPSLKFEDMSPSQVGIRPKLFIDGAAHRDFLIEAEKGFVSCLGIESPGLTASLALREEVHALL